MGTLPGKVQLEQSVYEDGILQLVQTLHRIHQTPIPTDFHWTYAPYVSIEAIKMPNWTTNRKDWEKALQFIQNSTTAFTPVFIHRDYHPTNILWDKGQLSGVVDWINACIGPALVDVAHCRINLALLFGIEVADFFLNTYLNETQLTYTPHWDILSVFDFVDEDMDVYEGWTDLGYTELSSNLMKSRADEYIRYLSALIDT
jgi:aminoglycoside phosphotransferase (APT) family kinase protein